MGSYRDLDETEIATLLAQHQPHPVQAEVRYPPGFLQGEPRPAAVLVPFFRQDGAWQLLFTRRTETLPEHSGQVAFPGGSVDPGDPSAEAAALREAEEEIGLPPANVRILGKLSQLNTVTNYLITPVIGVIQPLASYRIAVEEVGRVFSIPLPWLANPQNHEIRERQLPPPFPPVPVIYFQVYDGELLWGVTARIMLNLLEVLFP